MSFLGTPTPKKSRCWHIFEKKYPQGTNETYEVCSKCGYKRKAKPKKITLIPFLFSAFQQSNLLTKLPLRKVRDFVEEHQFYTNWLKITHDGWRLPAVEEPYDECGLWKTFGCRNTKEHEKLGHKNKIYAKQFQWSCYRPVCKTCYPKWIAREANKATKRIEEGSKKLHMQPIHLVLSVSPQHYSFSYEKLKEIAKSMIKDLNIVGAAIIFHPFRYNESTRSFYYSPQFHVVGFGYIKGRIGIAYRKYGWVTVYLGVRRSVFQTFVYILSHAGIKKGVHTVTWLGKVSYSKLRIEKDPDQGVCPYCRCKLEQIYYEYEFHPDLPPGQFFEGLVDADGWYTVNAIPESEIKKPYSFEYAPTRDLNEVLKGIALAD